LSDSDLAPTTAPEKQWVEIAVAVFPETGDEVAAVFAMEVAAARAGVVINQTEIVIWCALEDLEGVLGESRRFATLLHERGAIPSAEVQHRPGAPESEWRDAWKRYFKTTRMTRQLVIVPSWDTFSPGPEDLRLDLDPGQAFGTGDHASTRLVLHELQTLSDQELSPVRVLDVGTGSGILAIAAGKLWPDSTGVCIDTDPLAVRCAAENFEANAVSARYKASGELCESLAESFDLLLANIQANVLVELAPTLRRLARPRAVVCLSGILSPQAQDVGQAFERAGFRVKATRVDEKDPQWSAIVAIAQ